MPRRIRRSLWSYLSAFLVLAAALYGCIETGLALGWFQTSALTVLLPVVLPALAAVWLFINKENKAPKGRVSFTLWVSSLAMSLAVHFAVRQALPAFGLSPLAYLGQSNPLGLMMFVDVIIRAIAFALCYGYLARLMQAARNKSVM